jgi:hypothetical protein
MASLEIATLLGTRNIDLSIACLRSLVKCAGHEFGFRIHDDGTLTSSDRSALATELPVARVVSRSESDEVAKSRLSGFPRCQALRDGNVLALKLFDVAFFESSPVLRFVDSDVLFLKPFTGAPFEFPANWAAFFPDSQSAYSVRAPDLLRNPWLRLPARLNSGYFGIPLQRFDLEILEKLLRLWRGRTPVWIEQTCWAATAGDRDTKLFDPVQFQIYRPDREISTDCVALHFVSSVRSHLARFVARFKPAPCRDPVAIRLRESRRLGVARQLLRESIRLSRRFLAGPR